MARPLSGDELKARAERKAREAAGDGGALPAPREAQLERLWFTSMTGEDVQAYQVEEVDALVAGLRQQIEELQATHPHEGTFRCTCHSYPHSPNCGLDARLVALRAEVAGLRQALHGDEAEIVSLRQQVRDYVEREAACCPEDVGFEEYIAALKKQSEAVLAGLRGLIAQWRENAKYGLVDEATALRDCARELETLLAQALAGRTEQG